MKNKQELTEDGAVATPSVTAGVEGPKLPIKVNNIFKRVQTLKRKRIKPENEIPRTFFN